MTEVIGTIKDACRAVGSDAGAVWYWITNGSTVCLLDGRRGVLAAEERDADGHWIVTFAYVGEGARDAS